MFHRILKLPSDHSFFLFGPRGVGKSTLLQERLPKEKTFTFNLLEPGLEFQLLQKPERFGERLESLPKEIQWIVVDEVQKVPALLNEVHRRIEMNPKLHFALTGSSARKLKAGRANLLAGRAFVYSLAPLTTKELGPLFDLGQALHFGTLPKLFSLSSEQKKKNFLRSYANTYLKEEIQSEGLVRNLPGFHRFLSVAAQQNGQVLSFANIAQDVAIDAKSVQSYFEILEDTLIGFLLPAFRRSIRKRQSTHPKFYFFDTGVKRALAHELDLSLLSSQTEYGRAFEHFIVTELMRMNAYQQKDYQFSYFKTNDVEIDLVLERPGKPLLFVEIKSNENVKDRDLRPLRSLLKTVPGSEGVCISREPFQRRQGSLIICPWQQAWNIISSV